MWDLLTANKKVLEYFIDKRNNAPHCVVCDKVLYDYQSELQNYLYMLEVKEKKIHMGMFSMITEYVFTNYPYRDDDTLHRHHVNYAKNIQVPTCQSCHTKIHARSEPKYAKWKPVDKRPKNQGGFDSNVYKPMC